MLLLWFSIFLHRKLKHYIVTYYMARSMWTPDPHTSVKLLDSQNLWALIKIALLRA